MKGQTLRLLFNFSLPVRAFRLFVTILAFSLQPLAFSQESVCAQVKIEIPQQLTLALRTMVAFPAELAGLQPSQQPFHPGEIDERTWSGDLGATIDRLVEVSMCRVHCDQVVSVHGHGAFHKAVVRFVLNVIELEEGVTELEPGLNEGEHFRFVGENDRILLQHGWRGIAVQKSLCAQGYNERGGIVGIGECRQLQDAGVKNGFQDKVWRDGVPNFGVWTPQTRPPAGRSCFCRRCVCAPWPVPMGGETSAPSRQLLPLHTWRQGIVGSGFDQEKNADGKDKG